jgi:hypothetical protein
VPEDQPIAPQVPKTRFGHAEPILRVSDMRTSLRYYVEVLGFRNADWGSDDFTCVTRDGAAIYLRFGSEPLTDRPFGSRVE